MRFDRSLIKILLNSFSEVGEQHYTHHFSHSCSSFSGKHNRPELRRYLRHMEDKGYVTNHDLGTNIHKWSLTQDGKDYRALLNADQFH